MQFLRVFLSRLLTVFIVFAMVSTSFVATANARFISPDDWDPVVQGVGTNRYSYADNDPINKSDPNGHAAAAVGGGGWLDSIGKAIGGLFSGIGRGLTGRAGTWAVGAGSAVGGGLAIATAGILMSTTTSTGNGEMRGDAKENTQGIATGAAGAPDPEDDEEKKDKRNIVKHEQYKDELRAQMQKPAVKDPELNRIMSTLFRPGAKVGNGSTAAAVRHELQTNTSVGGRLHTQKASEMAGRLEGWLQKNQNASLGDRAAAENVLRDLRNALSGK